MAKNENNYSSMVTLISRFRVLDEKGQKEVFKRIFVDGYFANYINSKVENFRNSLSQDGYKPSEEEVEEYRIILKTKAEKTIDSFIDTLNSEDEDLKCKMFESFIENYSDIEKNLKKEICGYNHDFTDWKIEEGIIPFYDEDGYIDDYDKGEYYERQCKYCGYVEKAYSILHKKEIEENYKIHLGNSCKKQTYTLKNKNEN